MKSRYLLLCSAVAALAMTAAAFAADSAAAVTDVESVAEAAADADAAPISGEVVDINLYGTLIPDFTVTDMLDAGYDYGDLLSVTIEGVGTMEMPFVTNFADVGYMSCCVCDYLKAQGEVSISPANASFVDRYGGEIGAAVTISMAEKGGYLETYNNVQLLSTTNREDYDSDEIYANFRMIATPGVAEGLFYRSSSPVSMTSNADRYSYADALFEENGIAVEIDLADSAEKYEKFINDPEYQGSYVPTLYENGKVVTLGIGSDMFLPATAERLGEAFRFILENDGPYAIHCNEGKDRAGFTSLLIEALGGASVDELIEDYMTTYENYFHLEKGSEKYATVGGFTVDRILYLLNNPEAVDDLISVTWDDVDNSEMDPKAAAENYLSGFVGLEDEEIAALEALITGEEAVEADAA